MSEQGDATDRNVVHAGKITWTETFNCADYDKDKEIRVEYQTEVTLFHPDDKPDDLTILVRVRDYDKWQWVMTMRLAKTPEGLDALSRLAMRPSSI
jgi:hypothetical protein